MTLAIAIFLHLAPPLDLETRRAAIFAAAVEAQVNREELWGIAWVEVTWRWFETRRSGKGACCYLGILGSRYGNPSCRQMENDGWLCVVSAQRWLNYWRLQCGKKYLECYNAGFAGKKRSGSYTRKVRKAQRRFE